MRTLFLLLALAGLAVADIATPREWLVIGAVDRRGRRPFNPDRVFDRYLLDRAAPPPRAGDKIDAQAWERRTLDDKGRLPGPFSYAYATLVVEEEQVVLAHARGGGTLWVNGDPHVGDVYGMGHAGVPVLLRKGRNHLFVRGVRGRVVLAFTPVPRAGVLVAGRDATLPHLLPEPKRAGLAGVVLINASTKTIDQVSLRVTGADLVPVDAQEFTPIGPLGMRKLAVRLTLARTPEPGRLSFAVAADGAPPTEFETRVTAPAGPRRVTFVSEIDGSVQQYSLLAPTGDPAAAPIVLTLHGAGVDAFNQVRSYAPKKDFWIVAPTNRRPFGFDWQDWGRRDAYEVLAHARATTGAGTDRLFLTGHSMGGHGTWHLAANDPDAFTAIAPSAGWASFDTYAGGRPGGKRDALWRGADGASLTRELIRNLVPIPTFVLHGAKDDNVPLREAELMLRALRDAGGAPQSHVQEGAGHWWDGDASPGADCVDWPGIFELFRESAPRRDPERLDFTTADPGVDATHFWVQVHQPEAYGQMSRIRARRAKGLVEIRTQNIRRFRVVRDGEPVLYSLDEQPVEAPATSWFVRVDGKWRVAGPPVPGEKSPAHAGPFKRAFDNRFVLVYGKDDREGYLRARYDAQTWWYRGNGDAPVVSDERFRTDAFAGRNVILYGNAKTNAAFARVLPDGCPIEVREGAIAVGERAYSGPNLGCVFVYPRRGAPGALVGVCGYTGPAGARLGFTLLPFVSGVGYPDYAVFGPSILTQGDAGVTAAGWFAHDWSLDG